ncbi:putative nuclear pore protein [Diplodia seriata]|uniref:Putative nuclear pore protein n=1 Tax=Diplodia seriata TaxID=420778 RepID=A0A0G2G7X8_9PEZI|nr:putative nuclear pore protein [Diplodia seriata]
MLALACDAWKSMFAPDSQFKAPAKNEDGMAETLLEDNPQALALLLRIAHLRFDEVPRRLSLEELYNMAILTDKYLPTRLVKPWAGLWIELLKGSAKDGNRGWWLWIAWEYGEEALFEELGTALVTECAIDAEQYRLVHDGTLLYEDAVPPSAPSDMLERVFLVRNRIIHEILDVVYDELHTVYVLRAAEMPDYLSGDYCSFDVRCSVAINLHHAGLRAKRPASETIICSINELVKSLEAVERFYPVAGTCGLSMVMAMIVSSTPSPVGESHRIHMERQRKTLSV